MYFVRVEYIIKNLQPCGHYMYRQLNIQEFYVVPTQSTLCFMFIWRQTAIISMCNINWFVL